MRLTLLLTIFIYSTFAFALESLDPNLVVKNIGAVNCSQCSTEESKLSDEELFQQCAVDMCGKPGSVPSELINEKNIDTYLTPELRSKVDQETKKFIAPFINEYTNFNIFLLDQYKKRGAFKFTEVDPISLFIDRIRLVKSYYTLEVEDTSLQNKIKKVKFKDSISGLSLDTKKIVESLATKDARGKSPECEDQQCERILDNLLNLEFRKKIEELQKKINESTESRQIESYFHPYVAMLTLKKMQEVKDGGLSTILDKISDQFITKVFKGFSIDSSKEFKKAIKTATISMNDGQYLNSPDDLSKLLADTINKIKEKKNEISKGDSFTLKNFLLYEHLYGFNRNINFSYQLASEAVGYGSLFSPSLSISLNLLALTRPDYSSQSMAHELGHILNKLVADGSLPSNVREQYMKWRSCASLIHTSELKNNYWRITLSTLPGDSYWTSEDTADLMEYLYANNNDPINSCSFLDGDDSKYFGLQLKSPKDQKGDVDVHSANFLRLLLEAINRRIPLSSACKEVTERYKKDYRFEPCI